MYIIFSRTYSPINNVNARPLGYKRATLVFGGDDLCYSAAGVDDGRGVEVAVSSLRPKSSLQNWETQNLNQGLMFTIW